MSSGAATIPAIDDAAVKRIGHRLAKGLTLEQACVLEKFPINPVEFQKVLNESPFFRMIVKRAEAEYIEDRIADIPDPVSPLSASGAKWLLERTKIDQFGGKPSMVINQNRTYIAGVPNDALDRIRTATRKACKKADVKEVKDI